MDLKAESVSHIMELPTKTSVNISTGIEAMAREVARVRNDFTDYEERKPREFEILNGLMSELIGAGSYHVVETMKQEREAKRKELEDHIGELNADILTIKMNIVELQMKNNSLRARL